MLRLIAKAIGMLALVIAVITAVLDLTRSIANSALTINKFGQDWASFDVSSLQYLQVGIERHLGLPWIWTYGVQNILLMPTWLVFLVLAIIFLWMGRKRKRHWQERFGR